MGEEVIKVNKSQSLALTRLTQFTGSLKLSEGPAEGEARDPNLILASTDRVALDTQGIKIIQKFKGNSLSGIDPLNLPQIKRAAEFGIGSRTGA